MALDRDSTNFFKSHLDWKIYCFMKGLFKEIPIFIKIFVAEGPFSEVRRPVTFSSAKVSRVGVSIVMKELV